MTPIFRRVPIANIERRTCIGLVSMVGQPLLVGFAGLHFEDPATATAEARANAEEFPQALYRVAEKPDDAAPGAEVAREVYGGLMLHLSNMIRSAEALGYDPLGDGTLIVGGHGAANRAVFGDGVVFWLSFAEWHKHEPNVQAGLETMKALGANVAVH